MMTDLDRAETLVADLKTLNNAALGSFGEYLFEIALSAQGRNVVPIRSESTDFLVNNERVDVKTTRAGLGRKLNSPRRYSGPKLPGIRYAVVEFGQETIRISCDLEVWANVPWRDAVPAFAEWKRMKRPSLNANARRERDRRAWRSINRRLTDFFAPRQLVCKAIYRTTQKGFGRESPANLKPSRRPRSDLVRVFVSFDGVVSEDHVEYVVAFLFSQADQLPMVPKAKTLLHKDKVDLMRIPDEFYFANLHELFDRFDAQVLGADDT